MLKVGVIGVGSMGKNHARVYSEIAKLVGIYDLSREMGEDVASRFDTEYFSDMDALLSRVDAVTVATPTSVHAQVALAAMEAGVDVLIEKPFTGSSQIAEGLCRKADEEDLTLMVGLIERFNPVVAATRESLAHGRLGEIISMSTRRVSSFPSRIRDVGVVMDLGIHDVDVMRHVSGQEVVSVYAVGGCYRNQGYDDHAVISLGFADGTTGHVETNWLTPLKVRSLSLTCSGGLMDVDFITQTVKESSSTYGEIDPADMSTIPLEYNIRTMALRHEEPLRRELVDFLRAAEGRSEPLVSGWDALQSLQVCEAALASLNSGAVVHTANV